MTTRPRLSLSVQYPDARLKDIITRQKLRRWVTAALQMPAEITLRFVDAEEGQALNRDYRGKDYATNVLTFPYDEPEISGPDAFAADEEADDEATVSQDDMPPAEAAQQTARADIVLCTDVLEREAQEQAKSLDAHAAHLVVHGTLHAQGYDHITDEEAQEMETLETKILAKLGYPDPYK